MINGLLGEAAPVWGRRNQGCNLHMLRKALAKKAGFGAA